MPTCPSRGEQNPEQAKFCLECGAALEQARPAVAEERKFIGDAVIAVFGAPVAHEDDPERAARASLRILEAIEDLSEQEPELELQVRIGVNTGGAVIAFGMRPEQGEGIATDHVANRPRGTDVSPPDAKEEHEDRNHRGRPHRRQHCTVSRSGRA